MQGVDWQNTCVTIMLGGTIPWLRVDASQHRICKIRPEEYPESSGVLSSCQCKQNVDHIPAELRDQQLSAILGRNIIKDNTDSLICCAADR